MLGVDEIPQTVPLRVAPVLLIIVPTAIALLGIFREVYVASFGEETALQGLRMLALDGERNLGTWYSSILMVFIAGLSYVFFRIEAKGLDRARWQLLTALFLYLSVDESLSIHEIFSDAIRDRFELGGILYFAWVIPGILIVAALAVCFSSFVLRQPRPVNLWMATSASLYVGGALGLELVGGYSGDSFGFGSARYIVGALAEEVLELAGLTVFAIALLILMRMRRIRPCLAD